MVRLPRSILLVSPLVVVISMCGCKSSPKAPTQGFTVTTTELLESAQGDPGPPVPLGNMRIFGTLINPIDGAGGTVGNYSANTGFLDGTYFVNNGIAPAAWDHTVYVPAACAQAAQPPIIFVAQAGLYNIFEVLNYGTANLGTVPWICNVPWGNFPTASSRFAFAGTIPPSVTLSAFSPFSTQYGSPELNVYDGLGGSPNLVATITAASVSPDGSTATFPLPSSLASNGYGFGTANAVSPGSYQTNGLNYFSVASSQTVAGNPFGVAVAGQTQTYEDLDTCNKLDTTRGSYYSSFPIISLYSKNQVLIGNAAVTVGANPTAVAAYSYPTLGTTTTEGCFVDTNGYSGSTRAIVANSGGNSVSILDIVNDLPLYNVTVGNQPVALAVNTAGTAAYVANYKDSTVTEVNLTTGAAAGTVAVGGKPTSVALTAAGTLWVGGVGFLTEINASTLAVTATETAAGKTIVALGYSDQVGQLAATTVDGGGNVYVEKVSPSSVKAGGTYTPAASTAVSTLGTHLNTQTQANVLAYTSTLASESIINTNQVGAPPLVVQDGWAVFTATPTGFTVSDISGNMVLFSEKTPSPVTAIAVDPNLNAAYLTMPDSNTILTVPLPGTGTN